jgi:hypothetical protein
MAERHTDSNPSSGTGTSTGAGAAKKLAEPKPPDLTAVHDTPVMGIVPPEPSMPDEAGDIDYTLGDPTRVRQEGRGSETPAGESSAKEHLRKELYEKGATEVSEID